MTTPSDAPTTVVRSEERLVASTRSSPVRRAVLRKVIVSEERTVTVVVRHEELRLDYVDVAPGESPASSAALPLQLVLHEEQVVVTTAVVPVERVRVDVHRVVEHRDVTDTVRAERVEIDVDGELLPDAEGSLADASATARHRA